MTEEERDKFDQAIEETIVNFFPNFTIIHHAMEHGLEFNDTIRAEVTVFKSEVKRIGEHLVEIDPPKV